MNGYVIVRMPVEGMIVSATSARVPAYRGLDRDAWRCVDEHYYAKALQPDLVAVRTRSLRSYVGNFSPGTVETVEEAFLLLSACDVTHPEFEVARITLMGEHMDTHQKVRPSGSHGVDGYVDGFGSPLVLGMFQKPDIFQDFLPFLNESGLFDSVETWMKYFDTYCEKAERAGLEPLERWRECILYAVSPVTRATR